MSRRRVLVLVVSLAFAVAGPILGTARPAAADDCSQQVKGIGDLNDPSVVEDCLRTGSNWGRTIGTVVAVSGLTIAVVGLRNPLRPNRPPRPAPPQNQEGLHSADPCVRAVARVKRLQQLEADRLRLEQNILREFRALSADSLRLADAFRGLKEAEYKAYLCVVFARTFNFSLVGSTILGVGGAIARLGAAGAAAMSPAVPEAIGEVAAAQAARAAFQQQAMTTATTVINVGTAVIKEQMPTVRVKPASGRGDTLLAPLSPAPLSDPLATDIQQKLSRALGEVASAYVRSAKAFNQAAGQWAVNRQQDLDDARERFKTEAANWLEDAEQCPGAPDPWGGTPPTPGLVTLQVPQLPVTFGTGWILGGMVY